MATSLEKENSESEHLKPRLKIDLVSHSSLAEGLVTPHILYIYIYIIFNDIKYKRQFTVSFFVTILNFHDKAICRLNIKMQTLISNRIFTF